MPRKPLLLAPQLNSAAAPPAQGQAPKLANSPTGRLSSALLQISDLLDATVPSAKEKGTASGASVAARTAEVPQAAKLPEPQAEVQDEAPAEPCCPAKPAAKPAKSRGLQLLVPSAPEEAPDADEQAATEGAGSCYRVSFTRTAHKKRRSFEDGVLHVKCGKATLYTDDGKDIQFGRSLRAKENLASGAELKAGNYLMEVEKEIPIDDFLSGRAFATQPVAKAAVARAPEKKRRTGLSLIAGNSEDAEPPQAPLVSAPPPGALVLGGGPDGQQVYLEPSLSQSLRPHQKDGILFMFRHLLADGGCILADSMGLGKTLQALCVLWTALSKPAGKPLSRKAAVVCPSSLCGNWEAEVAHWLGPLRLKPTVVQGGGSNKAEMEQQMKRFLSMGGPASAEGRLLIISYDQLRSHADQLTDAIDLCFFDEGHRLKSSSTSTTQRINAMKCQRRILLTGTPLQNNLEEFWCCCSFVQPKLLPALPTFQRVYMRPISKAQDASASQEEVALGHSRSAELTRLTSAIILRRGPEILEQLLPPRTELLLTVALTPAQATVYQALCEQVFGGKLESCHLHMILCLRQLCTTPEDLRLQCFQAPAQAVPAPPQRAPKSADAGGDSDAEQAADVAQPGANLQLMEACRSAFAKVPPHHWASEEKPPKMALVEALLAWVKARVPGDGVVIVSNFVTTLTRCQELCARLGFATTILMGATPPKKRVSLVQEFNALRGPRVFLLTTKAGGVGLNIIGANRLLLLEPDWNPANDLQAMGRVWRQGQKKPVFIYRLATHGTLEEKILRRQERKQGLANVMVDSAHADGMQVDDWKELRKVYVLSGYNPKGHVIATTEPCEPAHVPLLEEAGLRADAVSSVLLNARVLATTAVVEEAPPPPPPVLPPAAPAAAPAAAPQEPSATGGSWARFLEES